jgi:hypothetical protein
LTARERAQTAIYGALFVVLAGSGTLFLWQYGTDVRFWESFTFGYLLLLVVTTNSTSSSSSRSTARYKASRSTATRCSSRTRWYESSSR